jgi:nicotinamide phosphoribosyltransferase
MKNFTPKKVQYDNFVGLSDSYKFTHAPQYPKHTQNIISYFESRGGKFDETVANVGLQYQLIQYFTGQVVTQEKIDKIASRAEKHFFGNRLFNKAGWEYILHQHGGRLPLSITAVPEGTVVPTHNVLMDVEVTDPNCYWLTNFAETLLVQNWYPQTVATLSREFKKVIMKYLVETGDPAGIDFKLHDFGFRGVSSVESAAIGGAAHLVNFKGTDTFIALELIEDIYGDDCAGFSIPASEHSTMTSWGRLHEEDAYANMLKEFPEGFVACVSDSYDIFNACRNIWGGTLKNKVLERNGVLVVRPDSGNPRVVVPEIIKILGEQFGMERNAKGYDVLNPHVRVIQGDGVSLETGGEILQDLKDKNQSADNLAFGMGGGLLQKLDRDTEKFAFKCSEAVIDGKSVEVFKDPITDPGKRSKAGRLALVKRDGVFQTVTKAIAKANGEQDHKVQVFLNGDVTTVYDWATVVANAAL